MSSNIHRSSGFSKWELIIVLGVIAILAIVAIPAYHDYTVRSRIPESAVLPTSSVDKVLDELSWGNIAFNNPGTVGFGQTAVVQLLLSGTITQDDLYRQIEEKGVTRTDRLRFANEMEANLIGKAFDISPITKERQAVDGDGVTEWKWEIRGEDLGKHRLFLTLNAHVVVNDRDMQHTVETFSEVMVVNIVWPESAIYFFTAYWQFVLTALVLPLIGWAASRAFRSRKRSAE